MTGIQRTAHRNLGANCTGFSDGFLRQVHNCLHCMGELVEFLVTSRFVGHNIILYSTRRPGVDVMSVESMKMARILTFLLYR